MRIAEVRLENIKSFAAEQRIELRPGVNALIGSNGAGKSTVVEAIGAALFGEVPYKQDEFVRRGEKSGRVTVAFESPLDERDYEVVRQFGRGATWFVYDPEIGNQVAQGEKAVTEWLHEHLRLSPDLELKSFFRENVGPPQGTLTAPFLGSTSERKARFAPILQVEGYDRAFQELLPAKQHIQALRSEVELRIEADRARLERRPVVEAELRDAIARALEADRSLAEAERTLAETRARRELLDAVAAAVKQAEAAHALAQERLAAAERDRQRAAAQLESAEAAERERADLEADFARFGQVEHKLRELQARRTERDRLLEQARELQRQYDRLEGQEREARAGKARAEEAIEQLRALARALPDHGTVGPAATMREVQTRLQAALQRSRDAAQAAARAQDELARARDLVRVEQPRQARVRQEMERVAREIERCEAARPAAARLDEVAAAAAAARRAHADAAAVQAITLDARRQLSGGLCPILREQCLNVESKSGGDLSAYFAALVQGGERTVRSTEAAAVLAEQELVRARAAAEDVARLPDLQARLAVLEEQLGRVGKELDSAQHTLGRAEEIEREAATRQAELAEVERLSAEAQQLIALARQGQQQEQVLEQLQPRLDETATALKEAQSALAPYESLETELRACLEDRDRLQPGRDRYLALTQLAEQIDQLRAELAVATDQAQRSRDAERQAALDLESRAAQYDPDSHDATRTRENELIAAAAATRERSRTARLETADRQREIEELEQVERGLAGYQAQFEELSEAVMLVEHLRQSLRQAGPQIIRTLLARVSEIASAAFADVMGDHGLELEWRSDYEIVVRQHGAERTFRQLSGGEQMAAALCVRMAIHHLFGDLRLLILDEPTTNMDDARRANLAQQVEALRGYDQIILVSHSDEFDGMFGHIVHLNKSNGRSSVVSELAREVVGEAI